MSSAYLLQLSTASALLRAGESALAAVKEEDLVLVCGAPVDSAYVLGRWQRGRDALVDPHRAHALRRRTGGPTFRLGPGTLYVGLAMKHASVLMETPPTRILNRTVRPLLAALRAGGLPAHYFGRDFVSVDKRPAGALGWARTPDGRVLFEVALSVRESFAPPRAHMPDEIWEARGAAPLMGKEPLVLDSLRPELTELSLAEHVIRAYESALGQMLARGDALAVPPDEEALAAPEEDSRGDEALLVRWSAPRGIPIGVARAGAALDARGHLSFVSLAGDFYQDDDAPERLASLLLGGPAQSARVRDAINQTYARGAACIEGTSSLQPLLEALLEASEPQADPTQ